MSSSRWSDSFIRRVRAVTFKARPERNRPNRSCRPRVEALEERCLLTGGITYYDLPPDDAIGPSAFHVGPDHTVYLADVLSASIARVSSDGQVQELAIHNAYTGEMEFGPDGNLWYPTYVQGQLHLEKYTLATDTITDIDASSVPSELPDSTLAANLYWFALQGHAYWFSSTGDLKQFPVPYRDGQTDFLSREQSPDGNIWFIHGQNIGRMTLSGEADQFAVPGGYAGIGQPVVGSDGNLWTLLTYTGAPTVQARITPDGTYTTFSPPGGPGALTLYPGTDGSILASDLHGVIYRLDPSSNSGQFVVYHLPTGTGPFVGAPGGVIWFIQSDGTDSAHLGRLDPSATPDGSGTLVTTTQGSSFSVTLTNVFLADPANSSATIDWGDGNVTNGTLVAGGLGGGFAVVGSNTYTSAGTYSIAVTIHSQQAAPITFYATARVATNPNAHFLNRVYQELLHRSADPTGMAGWLAAMNQGMTRSEVVAQIEASTEYRRDLAERYYQTYLGRSASEGELNPWVAFLASGASQELLKIEFLCSPEYALRAGNTAVGILQAVYQDVLGRAVDPAGSAAWLTLVGHTITRPLAVDLILRSAEASRDLVQDYYARYLGRQADLGGLTSWSTMLQNGGQEETVQAGILGSTEFLSEP